MVTLEKITPALFPNLYESFLVDDDPLSTEQDWRNVFDSPWDHAEGHCGYALLDQDRRVVGMIGMVFSERLINGSRHKLCNLHTWWVREDHRSHSLLLLRPVLNLRGYTITHFTPCDKVRAISRRLGFQDISTQLKILLPIRRRNRRDDRMLIHDPQAIEEHLRECDRRILRNHRHFGCGHLLVRDGSDHCYVLYTHVVRHRLPYCHIHYVSNREIYAANEQLIRRTLLKRHRAPFVAVDTRLVGGMQFPRSFDFWAPAPGLYKSDDLGPEQIDNLYSDIVFLKLTTLPDITHEVCKLATGWGASLVNGVRSVCQAARVKRTAAPS